MGGNSRRKKEARFWRSTYTYLYLSTYCHIWQETFFWNNNFFGKKKTFKFSQLFNNYNNNSNISLASQNALMTLRSPWKTWNRKYSKHFILLLNIYCKSNKVIRFFYDKYFKIVNLEYRWNPPSLKELNMKAELKVNTLWMILLIAARQPSFSINSYWKKPYHLES